MQCKQMMMMTITDRKTLHANRLPTTTTTKTLDNNSTENVETAKHIFKAQTEQDKKDPLVFVIKLSFSYKKTEYVTIQICCINRFEMGKG